MKAIGIDLGTTNSLAAIGGKEVKVLPTRGGEPMTPSVVGYYKSRRSPEGEIIVGRQAVANAVRAPEDTIYSIKRLMGALYGDKRVDEVRNHINYRLADPPTEDDPNQGVKVMLGGNPYSPIDISAMILRQVQADAELALGEAVTHAVITVPAYFAEHQRSATKQSAEQAGIKVLKIIDEPTAAAIFFGKDKEDERHRVLVYDLGGGTFDISIIQMVGGQFQVLEIEGDRWLGGDDFDRKIMARMIEWVKVEYDIDLSQDKNFLGKAKEVAEKAKIALAVQQSVEIGVPLLKVSSGDTIDIEMTITREEFENDIFPLVDGTIELVKKALKNQNLTSQDITEVLMVGGSTALPLVQQAVSDYFGREKVKRHINPMECVALGAAILADSYELKDDGETKSKKEGNLIEVTAMHLGIAAVRGNNPDAFVPIIEKGTPYPLSAPKRQLFYPVEENQDLIRVPVYEGLCEMASLNEQAGIIELPLRQGLSMSNAVEVSFNYDHNRVLTVGVRVLGKDLHLEQSFQRDRPRVVNPVKGDDNLVDAWQEDLQPSLRAGKQFLETYGDYMDEDDRKEMEEAIIQGQQAIDNDNQVEGKRATQLLHSKLLGSGTASQLFMAERAMQGASPEIAKDLALAVARIREAHAKGDTLKLNQLTSQLRVTVAQLMLQRSSIRGVEDKKDLQNLLRVKE